MADYSSTRYASNYLTQVIVRVDFLEFIPSASLFLDELEKTVLKYFPKRGIEQIIRFNSINLSINPDESNNGPLASQESIEGIQREYYSNNSNKFVLSNKFLIFDLNSYSCFEDLRECFRAIVSKLFSKCHITSTRAGLRYINLFDSEKIRIRKNYFTSEISAIIDTKPSLGNSNQFQLIRSMSTVEYNSENYSLFFRYGLFNPAHPNRLKNNSFALDYDCFTSEPLDSSDAIIKFIDEGHQVIQDAFERSITDYLRKAMGNE